MGRIDIPDDEEAIPHWLDFGSETEPAPSRDPLPGAHAEDPEAKRRSESPAPLVMAVVGLVGVLLLAALIAGVFLLRDGDGAVDTATDAAPLGDTLATGGDATIDGVGGGSGIDYGSVTSLFDLGANSRVLTTSIGTDVVILDRIIPGTEGQGCEGIGPRAELVSTSSDGSARHAVPSGSGVGYAMVSNGANRMIITQGCEGIIDLTALASLQDNGDLVIEQPIVLPEGALYLQVPPVWSADGSRFTVSSLNAGGELELVSFSATAEVLGREPVSNGALIGEFGDGTLAMANGREVRIGDLAPIPVDGPDHLQLVGVSSHDQQLLAVFGGPSLLVLNSSGQVIETIDDPSSQILAVAWSPDGHLAFTSAASGLVNILVPGVVDSARTVDPGAGSAMWYGLRFADSGRALAFSGWDEMGAQVARAARFAVSDTARGQAAADTDNAASAASADSIAPEGAAQSSSLGSEPLSLRGMGPLRIGMTVAEAEAALGGLLSMDTGAGSAGDCRYATLAGDSMSPRIMVSVQGADPAAGTIERIDLVAGSATLSGISIGSSRESVLDAYGERIVATPHKYTFAEGGEYLTFVPVDEADANYRLVIETLNGAVTEIRSGRLPAVEFVEGCS